MPQFHDHRTFWTEPAVAALLEGERAWLAIGDAAAGVGTTWIAPAGATRAVPSAIELGLDARGEIVGAVRAQADALPFADASLRRVVLQHVLESGGAPSAFLGECARAIAPGGELVVLGTNPASAAGQRFALRARRGGTPLWPRLPNRVRALLGGLGFAEFTLAVRGPRWGLDGAHGWDHDTAFGACYSLRARRSGASAIAAPVRPAGFAVPAVGLVLLPRSNPRVGTGA